MNFKTCIDKVTLAVYIQYNLSDSCAKVAESVDAPVSEAGGSYPVRVQVPLFALCFIQPSTEDWLTLDVPDTASVCRLTLRDRFSDKNNLPFILDLIDFMCSQKKRIISNN